MLETLVSSRIRRTLFEHLLLHSGDRFYLRGLAKALQLPVSPLRRELKRLEQAGMLQAVPEGNMLFYTVNTASPRFVQLQHASLPAEASAQAGETTEAPSGARPKADSRMPETEALALGLSGSIMAEAAASRSPASGLAVMPVGLVSASPRPSALWSSPLGHPVLLGAAVVGMALMAITVSLVYVGMTNHRLASQASRVLSAKKTEVTVVVPQTSASGTMRGSRWHIVPGGFGGFSSASNSESF